MIQIEYAEDLMLRVPWGQAPSSNADNYVKALMTQHADTSDAVRAILSERLMSDAQKRLQEAGVDNVATLFEEGDAAERIVAAAKSQNADTIVMGTRGMNDLRGLVVGSVSHKVAHEATGTVVMVK